MASPSTNGTPPPALSAPSSWRSSFEPPPQKGPPPKIPLPKPPTQPQMQQAARSSVVSPLSQGPASNSTTSAEHLGRVPSNEYFANMLNYSPATPPRVPPRTNIRPPPLHRVSETDSIEEANAALHSPLEHPPDLFKPASNGSPVSPLTMLNHPVGTALPQPTNLELDPAVRKGSESNVSAYAGRPRLRSSLSVGDEEEPTPFTGHRTENKLRSDKHKRILGIDSSSSTTTTTKAPPPPSKRDKVKSESKKERNRSYPDPEVRSNSPMPTPDVVPFLYQDMEDVRRQPTIEAPVHERPISAISTHTPVPQLNLSSSSTSQFFGSHRHSSPTLKPVDKMYQTPLNKATTFVGGSNSREKEKKSKGLLSRFRAKKREDNPDGHDSNHPLANLGILSGSGSLTDLHLPGPTSTSMKHQQSFSSLSSGGGTPVQTIPSFNAYGTIYTTQTSAPPRAKTYDESKSSQSHHHPSIFHRHHSPSQSHTRPHRAMTVDDEIILDTDLGSLQGIVSNKVPQSVLEAQSKRSTEINPIAPWETSPRQSSIMPVATAQQSSDATWTAPESWGVRPHNAIAEDLPDFPEETDAKESKQMYCLRVFRTDSTFATMNCAANTSVQELLGMLAKKFFVPVGERWVLVHYHNNLARVLQPTERPIALQQKSLEKLGYVEEVDGGGEMGRDDWSGFWRFVFMRVDELSTIAEEVHIDQFQNVNLDSKNLQTIPLPLYRHSAEILTLNVSRNMSLSIPADFIDSCISLQEIKFTHNEARRIPKSIPAAPSLTHLDLSHNRLESLDLSGLTQLVSLKLANNKFKDVPDDITRLDDLRVLDLSSNSFVEFPGKVTEITSLADLDISFNAVEEVPEGIGNMSNLTRLIITNNKLKNPFPPSVCAMESLKELDCRYNSLHNVDVLATVPALESLYCGHNNISAVSPNTRFAKLRHFHMNKNPTTKLFLPVAPEPSRTLLTYLNIASAKLSALDEIIFDGLQNLERLILDDNAFTALPYLGKLKKLQYLHCANNSLQTLPKELGTMAYLKVIDVHNNNLKTLPQEIWGINTLEGLNVASNLLNAFPKPPPAHSSVSSSASGIGEELTSSPSNVSVSASRKNSSVSVGRMAKILSQESVQNLRKDSSASTMTSRTANTFAQSLKMLMLGDNRLGDDCFEHIALLTELKCLNLSYNEIYEIPPGALSRLNQLTELYLSGNELSSLPADDLERLSFLKVLHLNCNKLQTLPAELGKIRRLHVLDVGSNSLKYNISNWPYDWNWNWNLELKYLNMSGNKKLEIKQQATTRSGERDLSDFHALTKLRLLGLMDVTTMGTPVPDQTENRRVRTIGSETGGMSYGVADTLGKHDQLSVFELATPNFQGSSKEVLYQIFDGAPKPSGGNRVSKFLQDHFRAILLDEFKKVKEGETPTAAFRRTYLAVSKALTDSVSHSLPMYNGVPGGQGSNKRHPGAMSIDYEDLTKFGAVALTVYINGKTMTVANTGDSIAVLARTTGEIKVLSKKHRPGEASELERIRNNGGSLTRNGKISSGFATVDVSRAVGYSKFSPYVIAAPHVEEIDLSDQDEVLILANNELWKYVSHQTAVDVVRTERDDSLRAAQKLRDFAIGYGSTGRICVMVIRIGDLFQKRVRQLWSRNASQSYSAASGYLPGDEDGAFFGKKKFRGREELPEDSTLARLEREVPPPVGDIAMVFTDIKNSTMLWELHPVAMRSAIKTHNVIMRRQMRIIGGYEVKTEGDAFIVAFPTITAALQFCFAVQTNLLSADWPAEILESAHGSEIYHPDRGDLLHRGLSVRMGCHWGTPVCEVDPITRRMDYFGPMMNRTARISAVADGGQITISSDVEGELRSLEQLADTMGDLDEDFESPLGQVKRDMEALKRTGFAVSPVGERKLKGLENTEFIWLIYPNQLIGRLHMDRLKLEGTPPMQHQVEGHQQPIVPGPERMIISDDVRVIPLSDVRLLHMLAYRIEKLCSTNMVSEDSDVLQQRRAHNLREEDSDEVIIQAVESLVTRIENAITRLSLRHCAYQASSQDIILDDEDIIKAIQLYIRNMQEDKQKESSSRRLRRFSTYQGARYSMPATKSLGISWV